MDLLNTASQSPASRATSVGIISTDTTLYTWCSCCDGLPAPYSPCASLHRFTCYRHQTPMAPPRSTVCIDRITLVHVMQEFLMFYGFMDYLIFVLARVGPSCLSSATAPQPTYPRPVFKSFQYQFAINTLLNYSLHGAESFLNS